jgi:hypothetical protein
VALDAAAKGAGALADVRVEEGYLVNVTMNAAAGQLEGRLAPSFNRCVCVRVCVCMCVACRGRIVAAAVTFNKQQAH